MQLTRKNYTRRQQEINAHFQLALQQLINETFHSQLPKNFCKKAHRYTVALIPIAKGTPMKEVVQALLKQTGMMNESPERSAAE